MTKEMLTNLTQNKSFNDAIDTATPHRVKIMTDLSTEMKENQKEFHHILADANYRNMQELLKNKKGNDDVKAELRKMRGEINRTFVKVRRIVHPNEKKNGEPGDRVQSLVDNVVQIAQMLKYIGNTSLEDKLAASGITINVKPLESQYVGFDSDDIRARMKQLWTDVDNTQGEICRNANAIKIDAFESIDSSIRHSKDNKKGLRPAEFQKLVRNKAFGLVKDSEKFTKYMEKQRADNVANIEREELMLAKNKEL